MGWYLEVFHLLHDALAQVLLLCNFLLQLRAGAIQRRSVKTLASLAWCIRRINVCSMCQISRNNHQTKRQPGIADASAKMEIETQT
jgi:hypothetical protein